jgi:hypothetical protein
MHTVVHEPYKVGIAAASAPCIFVCLAMCGHAQNTRSCMKKAGLPTPANHLIRSVADCGAAAAVVGFPAVIKPISGAASEGVVRVDSLEQLEKCAPGPFWIPTMYPMPLLSLSLRLSGFYRWRQHIHAPGWAMQELLAA